MHLNTFCINFCIQLITNVNISTYTQVFDKDLSYLNTFTNCVSHSFALKATRHLDVLLILFKY